MFGISAIAWNTIPWLRTTLLHDRAIKLSKAKVRGCSDSVLCLGNIQEHPHSIEHWEGKSEWFMNSPENRESNEIDGKPSRVRVESFWGQTNLGLLREIQQKMTENRTRPEQFRVRIIFMSMYNGIDWSKGGNFLKVHLEFFRS